MRLPGCSAPPAPYRSQGRVVAPIGAFVSIGYAPCRAMPRTGVACLQGLLGALPLGIAYRWLLLDAATKTGRSGSVTTHDFVTLDGGWSLPLFTDKQFQGAAHLACGRCNPSVVGDAPPPSPPGRRAPGSAAFSPERGCAVPVQSHLQRRPPTTRPSNAARGCAAASMARLLEPALYSPLLCFHPLAECSCRVPSPCVQKGRTGPVARASGGYRVGSQVSGPQLPAPCFH